MKASSSSLSDMQVRYSCAVCGCSLVEVGVRYRKPGEDVVSWMEDVVMEAVTNDHDRRSPDCPSEKCELQVPHPEGQAYVGGPVLN